MEALYDVSGSMAMCQTGRVSVTRTAMTQRTRCLATANAVLARFCSLRPRAVPTLAMTPSGALVSS